MVLFELGDMTVVVTFLSHSAGRQQRREQRCNSYDNTMPGNIYHPDFQRRQPALT